jgi:catechol-2,3-dioxygenase
MKIEFLKLFTPQLKEQYEFYSDVLRLPVKKTSNYAFQVEMGYSQVEFCQKDEATPYHLALHIPGQQEELALKWLEERVPVLKAGEEKIVDFPAWKARSVYFYDADHNIVELISRINFFEPVSEGFSAKDIIGVSEIGLATNNVEEKFRFLNDNFGLQKFSGDYYRFCATGDDEGLFIIINNRLKDWIPTGDEAFSSPFELKASIEQATFGVVFKNDRLQLL